MISGLYITAFSNKDEGDGSSLRSCSTFHVPGSMYNVKHQTSNLKPDFRLSTTPVSDTGVMIKALTQRAAELSQGAAGKSMTYDPGFWMK